MYDRKASVKMNASNLALYHVHMRDLRLHGQPELISLPQ